MARSREASKEEAKKDEEPRKSGQDLLGNLKSTGTGWGRLEKLETHLREFPSISGEQLFEWMVGEGMPIGTLRKAGKFIYGDSYDYTQPGASVSDQVQALRDENAELRRTVRELEGKNSLLLLENQRLREDKAATTDGERIERIKQSEELAEAAT